MSPAWVARIVSVGEFEASDLEAASGLLAKPKSRTFTTPWGVIFTFPGFKSGGRYLAHAQLRALLRSVWILRKQCFYQDLGAGYFDRLNAEGLKRYLVKRLESLGQKVTLEPRAGVA